MRCLFVVDEIARFREVAVALDSRGIGMLMVREFKLAERIANAGGFDMVIVGTNSFASESMRFLQCRRVQQRLVIAVTCESELRRDLLAAGADRVVVLPDDSDSLKRAFDKLAAESTRMIPPSSVRKRGTGFAMLRRYARG